MLKFSNLFGAAIIIGFALSSNTAHAITASPGINLAQLAATVNALKAQQIADEATIAGLKATVLSQSFVATGQANQLTLQASQIATLTSTNAALQAKTAPITISGTDLTITGMNVHIVSGSGSTSDGTFDQLGKPVPGTSLTGLGNLIIGYNSISKSDTNSRVGSHNLILGDFNNYGSFGGFVAGQHNTIPGRYSSVLGGYANTARGPFSLVCGGTENVTSINASYSVISGGFRNTTQGIESVISGGLNNTTNGYASAISGGVNLSVITDYGWAAGSLSGTEVSGNFSSP